MNEDISQLVDSAKADFQKNNFQLAADKFAQCLEMLQGIGSPLEIAEIQNNLSVALLRCSKPQEALNAVLGTDQIFAEAGDKQKQGIALANIASAYEALKEFEDAALAYKNAIECFKESGDKKLRSITLRSLSDLQLKTGNEFVALATLQASYDNKPFASKKDKFFSSALGRLMKKLIGQ